jgi:hypothetical protein
MQIIHEHHNKNKLEKGLNIELKNYNILNLETSEWIKKTISIFLVTLQQELNSPYTEYKENDSNFRILGKI